jgi:hypothetical protein
MGSPSYGSTEFNGIILKVIKHEIVKEGLSSTFVLPIHQWKLNESYKSEYWTERTVAEWESKGNLYYLQRTLRFVALILRTKLNFN